MLHLCALLSACSGVLFCSPEVYTSNHKTELMDDAFTAVKERLGAPQTRQDSSSNLWVRDTTLQKWCQSPAASQLLVQHHKKYWAPLVCVEGCNRHMHCP